MDLRPYVVSDFGQIYTIFYFDVSEFNPGDLCRLGRYICILTLKY